MSPEKTGNTLSCSLLMYLLQKIHKHTRTRTHYFLVLVKMNWNVTPGSSDWMRQKEDMPLKILGCSHTYDSCTCVSGITYNLLKF